MSNFTTNDPSKIKFERLFLRKTNNKTITLQNISGSTTVKELKKLLQETEGISDVQLLYGAKTLDDDNKKLIDYGVKNKSTLNLLFKVSGGTDAEGNNAEGVATKPNTAPKSKDMDGPRKIPSDTTNWPKGVTKSTKKCCISLCDPTPGSVHALMVGCSEDHTISPDEMFRLLESTIKTNGWTVVKCLHSGCNREWDVDSCMWVARVTESEEKEFQQQLSKNFVENGENFKICPNEQCYVSRPKTLLEARVHCPACNGHDWCWWCLKPWIGENVFRCDYEDCDYRAGVTSLLEACDRVEISNVKNVPTRRLCPECLTLVQWKELCKHIKCPVCQHDFCMACLKDWNQLGKNTHISVICTVAPVQ